MKTRYPFYLLMTLSFVLGCKNTDQNPDKVKQLETELTQAENEIKALKEDVAQSKQNNNRVENLRAYGSFSISENKLYLSIPVASDEYEIIEEADVSSNDINALLVRVSDSTTNPMSAPVKHTIVKQYQLDNLGLTMSELENDEKLIVMTLNSTTRIQQTDIDSLRTCINRLGSIYNEETCEGSFRTDKKPNDKKGSIIIGFN